MNRNNQLNDRRLIEINEQIEELNEQIEILTETKSRIDKEIDDLEKELEKELQKEYGDFDEHEKGFVESIFGS